MCGAAAGGAAGLKVVALRCLICAGCSRCGGHCSHSLQQCSSRSPSCRRANDALPVHCATRQAKPMAQPLCSARESRCVSYALAGCGHDCSLGSLTTDIAVDLSEMGMLRQPLCATRCRWPPTCCAWVGCCAAAAAAPAALQIEQQRHHCCLLWQCHIGHTALLLHPCCTLAHASATRMRISSLHVCVRVNHPAR